MGEHLISSILQRALGKGDPLSLYLFILCMEVLGTLINNKRDAKLWNLVKSSQGGVAFSHLFFADDLALFAKVDRKNCVAVRDVLDTICSFSSQKVSMEKSWVFFSPNISSEGRIEMSELLGFQSTLTLGKYLGFPIKHSSYP